MALGSAEGQIILHADQALRGLNQVGDALNGVDRSSRQVGAAFGTVGRGAGILGAAIVGALGLGIKTAADFEFRMSAVQAVTGATGEEFANLSDLALQLGKDTVFSASEAAAAIEELGKAGVSTGDILSGAAQGAVDLAAAAGVAVPEAAVVMANALNIFNLAGTEATHVADVFAAAANKSAADVSSLALGMAQSGAVAASFGISLEATVGALALFADAGLKGSDAGTSFKTLLISMLDPTAEQAALMQDLGISFFDAQGNFIGLAGVADVLQGSLSGLTEEQRNTALAVLFGTDAIRAANILYDAGAEGVNEYTAAVNDSGAAQRAAETRLDNFRGSLEQLKGSLETAAIIVGGVFLPALRALVDGAVHLVNLFIDLPGPVQAMVAVIAAAAGGMLSLAGAFALAGPSILRFISAIKVIAPILLGISAPILAIVAALGLLAVAFKTNFLGFGDAVRGVADKIGDAFAGIVGAVGRVTSALGAVIGGIVTLFSTPFSATRFGEASEAIAGVGQALGRLGFGHDQIQAIRGALTKLALPLRTLRNNFRSLERASEGFLRIVTGKATRKEIEHFTARLSNLFGDETGTAITRAAFRVRDAFRDFGRGLREAFDLPPGTSILTAVITGLIGAVGGLVSFVTDRLIPALGPVLLAVLNGAAAAVGFLADRFDDIARIAGLAADGIGRFAGFVGDLLSDLLSGNWRAVLADFGGLFAAIVQAVRNAFEPGGIDIPQIAVNILDWLVGTAADLWGRIKTFVFAAFGGEAGGVGAETVPLGTVAVQVLDWLVGTGKDLWSSIRAKVLSLFSGGAAAVGAGGGASGAVDVGTGQGIDLGTVAVRILDFLVSAAKALGTAVAAFVTGQWEAVKSIGQELGGYVLRLGGWAVTQATGLIGAAGSLAGDVADFVTGEWDAIKGLGQDVAGYVVNVTEWVVTETFNALKNAVQGFVDDQDAIKAEFNNWTLVIHPPFDVDDRSQSKRQIEGAINDVPFILAELRAWDLVLFGPSGVDSTGQERGPVEEFLNGQSFEFELSFWDLVLGIPGVQQIGIVIPAIEDALRLLKPIQILLPLWDLSLPTPNLPNLTPGRIEFWLAGKLATTKPVAALADWVLQLEEPDFPSLSGGGVAVWIMGKLNDLGVLAPVLGAWDLLLDAPDFPEFSVWDVIGWISDMLNGFGTTIEVVLGLWSLLLDAPDLPDITAAKVIEWIAAALLAVGDISVPFPNKLSITLPDVIPNFPGPGTDIFGKDEFANLGGRGDKDLSGAFERLLSGGGFNFADRLRGLIDAPAATAALLKPFEDAAARIPGIMRDFTAGVEGPLQRLRATMQAIGQQAASQFQQTLSAGLVLSRQAVQSAADQMGRRLQVFASEAGAAGRNAGNSFRDGITGGMDRAVGAVLDALGRVRSAVQGFSLFNAGHGIGSSLGQGIAAGISSQLRNIESAAAGAVRAGERAGRVEAQAFSPSRLFMRLGRDLVEGLRLPFADLGPFMDGVFTQLFRDTGQMARQWVATLPNELAATADQIAGTVGRFIGAVIQDGDWLNDWLTHLPTALRDPAQAFGRAFASALELGMQAPALPGRALPVAGGGQTIVVQNTFRDSRIVSEEDANAVVTQAFRDFLAAKGPALGRAGAGA